MVKEFSEVTPLMISEERLEMEKQVLSYEENGKFGLIDFEGKKLTGAIYESVASLKNKPGCILVKKDGLSMIKIWLKLVKQEKFLDLNQI